MAAVPTTLHRESRDPTQASCPSALYPGHPEIRSPPLPCHPFPSPILPFPVDQAVPTLQDLHLWLPGTSLASTVTPLCHPLQTLLSGHAFSHCPSSICHQETLWFFFFVGFLIFFSSHLPSFFPPTCLDYARQHGAPLERRPHESRGTLLLLSALLLLSRKEARFLLPFRLGSRPFCPFLAADSPLRALCPQSSQTSSSGSPLPSASTFLLQYPAL